VYDYLGTKREGKEEQLIPRSIERKRLAVNLSMRKEGQGRGGGPLTLNLKKEGI